jgi:hypothetical protein
MKIIAKQITLALMLGSIAISGGGCAGSRPKWAADGEMTGMF